MKKLNVIFFFLVVVVFSSCKDDDNDDVKSTDYLTFLAGSTQKVWVISSSKQNAVEKCVSDCLKKNQTLTFKRNGFVTFSTYDCPDTPCGAGSSSQTGGDVPYTLNNEGTLLTLGGSIAITIVQLNESKLVLGEDVSGGTDKEETTFIPK